MLLGYRIFGTMFPSPLLRLLVAVFMLGAATLALPAGAAEEPSAETSGTQILQSFEKAAAANPQVDATDRTRRWVMFALGAPLLILLLITGSLGIAMGVYGKPVYLAHMVCAGLSVTLAIVHAIVGIVWFRPF